MAPKKRPFTSARLEPGGWSNVRDDASTRPVAVMRIAPAAPDSPERLSTLS
jgi:hypothetical protein